MYVSIYLGVYVNVCGGGGGASELNKQPENRYTSEGLWPKGKKQIAAGA